MNRIRAFFWGKINKVRMATIVCFIILMYVNRVVANDSQYVWLITNNFVGPAVTLIILSVYPTRDFKKPFYVIWTVLGLLGTIGGHFFWYTHQVGHIYYKWVTIPLNIWFLGAAVFKFIEEISIRKSFKIKLSKWEYPVIACMFLMVISASNTFWPFYYLIIFLMLWHTPFSRDERRQVLIGIFDGLIIGFIIMQCYAFFNTPYLTSRYRGSYWNCNRNSCLYLVALASVFGKCHMKKLEDRECRTFSYDIAISVLIAFIIYSGSRTGIIGAALIVALYLLLCEKHVLSQKLGAVIKNGLIYVLFTIVCIPLLYFPIRYLPEIKPFAKAVAKVVIRGDEFNHEFAGGISLREALTNNLLRYFGVYRSADDETSVSDETISEDDKLLVVSDPSGKYYTLEYEYMYFPERGIFTIRTPKWIYSGLGAYDCRINIYAALIDQMNLVGHIDEEVMLDIRSDVPSSPEVCSYNEQNFAIHYLFVYGILIGLLVCVLMLAELIYLIKRSWKKYGDGIIFLMLVSVYFIFGLTEIVWVPGQLEQILLFFAPLFFTTYDNCADELVSENS